ncbi:protein-L-isoaspartate O-methyltransferase [Archaeoglobales archaeon]|nr:MAG: protein-L-isoaspartate O-methyltransferase [Archaeoglobales archaeon]
MDEFKEKRERLVERLRYELDLSDKVVEAMKKVPRHLFIPPAYRSEAYVDSPLPIGKGQTISAPHMVAIMCELLDLRKGEKVLEVGAGCGYHAAVVAEIVGKNGRVVAIERISELAEMAKRNLETLGYDNVLVIVGDGSKGYEKEAPYDKIYVTASAPKIPEPLIEQLKPGGKLVIPVGDFTQYLYVVEKDEEGRIKKENWGAVRFVPLVGEHGFDD